MKEVVKFKEWSEFDLRCGKIKEIKESNILVDINADDLIVCDKGNLEYNVGDKVIILLINNEGKILSVNTSLLSVDKDVKIGEKVS